MSRPTRSKFVIRPGRSNRSARFIQFSRTAKSPFQKLQAFYGIELERLNIRLNTGITPDQLDPQLWNEIQSDIRQKAQLDDRQDQKAMVLSGLIFLAAVVILFWWIG